MAKKTAEKKVTERPDRLLGSIVLSSNARSRKDINQWRTALQQAENVENPKRILLINMYEEVMLDAHLYSEVQKRILRIIGKNFELYDESNKPNPEASALIRKKWFNDLLVQAMFAKFYGSSILEITSLDQNGLISEVKLVPRRHVIPEKGIITIKQGDEKGILYRTDPSVIPWIFEFGDPTDLGLINKCVPHVLFKRFAQSAWSEFTEVFGMPLRVAKTNTRDNESLRRMNDMMLQMATGAYAIISDEETIDFVENNKTNGDVYSGLMNYSAAEISKVVNGAVIGEATQGGSRAKEEVGLDILNLITDADVMALEGVINETVIPKLISHGYPFSGLTFKFDRSKDIKSEWEIVKGILQHYEVPEEYIIDTFNIPVTGKREVVQPGISATASSTDSFFE